MDGVLFGASLEPEDEDSILKPKIQDVPALVKRGSEPNSEFTWRPQKVCLGPIL